MLLVCNSVEKYSCVRREMLSKWNEGMRIPVCLAIGEGE